MAGWLMLCVSCHSHETAESVTTYAVLDKTMVTDLYYTSTVQPVVKQVITSPVDGIIEKVYVGFGEDVSKDQPLMEIYDEANSHAYADTIIAYLKTKKSFEMNDKQMSGRQELFDAGIISKNDLQHYQLEFEDSRVEFIQNLSKLRAIFSLFGEDSTEVETWTLEDAKHLSSIMYAHKTVTVRATETGKLLPYKSESGDSKGSFNMVVGDKVEKSQHIASITTADHYFFPIQVSEVDINKIKVGMKARITGDAFPHAVLQGVVEQVDSYNTQRRDVASSSVTFPVVIKVDDIGDSEDEIRSGMSAKVQLIIEESQGLMVPYQAVEVEDGVYTVQVKKRLGVERRQVKIGQTTPESYEVTEGLQVGDVVLIPHD